MGFRFERIGVSDRWVDYLGQEVRDLEEYLPEKAKPTSFGDSLRRRVEGMMHLAIGHYLLDEVDDAQSWAERELAEAERYFYGDWRQNMPGRDAEYWAKGGGGWHRVYRSSAAFASSLHDQNALKRLSEFPRDDTDDGGDWKAELSWYLLLAEYLARGATDEYDRRLAEILDGTVKWPRLLAETLDAIVRERNDEVPAKFAEHFKYFHKSVKKRYEEMFQLDLDGTILYHLAARLGHPFKVDEKTLDHLIIFQ